MTYPKSSAVTAGQATEADQYNDLRKDALYLGNEPAGSGTIRDLLASRPGTFELSRQNKNTITLTASAEAPAAVMLNGTICTAANPLTLALTSEALPDPGRYYIYALCSAGSFTLAAGSAAPSGGILIGTFLWTGTGIIPGSVREIREFRVQQAALTPAAAHGRLTLVAGDPVPTEDVTFGEVLYYVPFRGNRIGLYLYGSWEYFSFTEISISIKNLMRNVPYDVFLGADENGLSLSLSAWANAGGRPSGALRRRDGIRVSASDESKRYLGSFALNASGYAEDSRSGRLLWNENNRVQRQLLSVLSSENSEGSAAENKWVPYFGSDAPSVRILVPDAETEFNLKGVGISTVITNNDLQYRRSAAIGICKDMVKETPYTGNTNAVPVFLHSFGNAPVTVELMNLNNHVQGYHEYTLGFWTNYTFLPQKQPDSVNTCGACPGLFGCIKG